jgi:hypothetical protein
MGNMSYTAEQDDWLREHYYTTKTFKELTERFNAYFNTDRTQNGIQGHVNKALKLARHHFTEEQESWLIKHYDDYRFYDELTEAFNLHFNTNRSVISVQEKCNHKLGLKGKLGRSSYRYKDKEQLPVGTIRKSQTATYIKVQETPSKAFGSKINNRGYREPYWVPLQKKIYQDVYGPIKPGQMVCFLDGDSKNFELDNLYCIDRRISALLTKNKWWTGDRELTRTAIKWCEYYYAIREATNNV